MPLEASSHADTSDDNIGVFYVFADAFDGALCEDKELCKRRCVELGLDDVELDRRESLRGI